MAWPAGYTFSSSPSSSSSSFNALLVLVFVVLAIRLLVHSNVGARRFAIPDKEDLSLDEVTDERVDLHAIKHG